MVKKKGKSVFLVLTPKVLPGISSTSSFSPFFLFLCLPLRFTQTRNMSLRRPGSAVPLSVHTVNVSNVNTARTLTHTHRQSHVHTQTHTHLSEQGRVWWEGCQEPGRRAPGKGGQGTYL
ncbi:unnamed protein product [Arctogadus glacialis]